MQAGIIQEVDRVIVRRASSRSLVSAPPSDARFSDASEGDANDMGKEDDEAHSLVAEYLSSLPSEETNALMMEAPPQVRVSL
jgi:hypothetical protein